MQRQSRIDSRGLVISPTGQRDPPASSVPEDSQRAKYVRSTSTEFTGRRILSDVKRVDSHWRMPFEM